MATVQRGSMVSYQRHYLLHAAAAVMTIMVAMLSVGCGGGSASLKVSMATLGTKSLAPPASSPSFVTFAGYWYIHDGDLVIRPNGAFAISLRLFRTCGEDPPPCDNSSGSGPQNGDRASGELTSLSGNEASGTVTWTSDQIDTPNGRIVISFDPQSDTLTADGSTYCGRYAPSGTCGA